MSYQYFRNHKTYPLSLPRRPVGGQVPVPVGHYVEGPYYASLARGNDPLLVEVPEDQVPKEARVETVDEAPLPGERRLLAWSQTRYMERQKGVFDPGSMPPPTPAVSVAPPLAPEANTPTSTTSNPSAGPEGQEKATEPQGGASEAGNDGAQRWSKTKLRALGIAEVRTIAAQIAEERGMSLPEGNPSKEILIEFIVSATAE